LIWNLYEGQAAFAQIGGGLSSACLIGRGVRQGCSSSPLLYLIYDDAVVKEASYNTQLEVLVGGQVCNMIRFADDKAVVSSTQKGLQQLMDDLN